MKSTWQRVFVLTVGLTTFALQVIDRFQKGHPGDPTLVYASVVIIGLGLGLNLDSWRRK